MREITWVDPTEIPDAGHLLHHSTVWCVVNADRRVAVYDHGTGRNQANALQGNRNRSIAVRFVDMYAEQGAVGVELFNHIFLADSPGRY